MHRPKAGLLVRCPTVSRSAARVSDCLLAWSGVRLHFGLLVRYLTVCSFRVSQSDCGGQLSTIPFRTGSSLLLLRLESLERRQHPLISVHVALVKAPAHTYCQSPEQMPSELDVPSRSACEGADSRKCVGQIPRSLGPVRLVRGSAPHDSLHIVDAHIRRLL